MASKGFLDEVGQLQQAAELAKVAGSQQLVEKVRGFTSKYGKSSSPSLETELAKVRKLPGRQDSTTDQLRDLYAIAIRFGMQDAAIFVRQQVEQADAATKVI